VPLVKRPKGIVSSMQVQSVLSGRVGEILKTAKRSADRETDFPVRKTHLCNRSKILRAGSKFFILIKGVVRPTDTEKNENFRGSSKTWYDSFRSLKKNYKPKTNLVL